jgi:hypothetical protein
MPDVAGCRLLKNVEVQNRSENNRSENGFI